MKSNKKNKVLGLLLSLSMLLGMLPAAAAAEVTAPVSGTNIGKYEYEYNRWATPIDSYLLDNGNGTFTRVEYTGEVVTAELYNSSYEFISGRTIDLELPIFGGFYRGTDSYFLIEGQENPNEDDSREVVRVIRYTKNWERVGSASLYGANTVSPFVAGSLRCVEYNGYLYIRTAHEMYADDKGTNHQANLTMNVRIRDMVMTDSYSKVMNSRYGYISHSFNQFITVADGQLVAVDHGDAKPRAVVLTRYLTAAGQDKFMKDPAIVEIDGVLRYKYVDTVNVLNIGGASGNNDTGVALGGFEASGSHYLIAGNTIDQSKTFNHLGQRNIFVSATSVSNFTSGGTTVRYLTNHTSGVTVSNPQMVKIDRNRYAVLWMETAEGSSLLKWTFVDGTGNPVSQVYSGGAVLSDCQPIVNGGKLVWYVTSNSAPAFMTIDLQDPTQVTHRHINSYSYAKYPTTKGTGRLTCACAVCGVAGEDVIMPAIGGCDEYYLNTTERAPTCTAAGYGYYKWTKLPNYNVAQYSFGADIPALGHTGQTVTVAATCTTPGSITGTCTTCGTVSTQTIPALGHHYERVTAPATCTDPGSITNTCTTCGDTSIETIPALGHHYETVTVPATCTDPGSITDTCTRCGSVTVQAIPVLGHSYENGVCKLCGAVDAARTVLSGKALGGNGDPLTVSLSQNGITVYSVTVTGEDYQISDIVPGEYTLSISGETYVTRSLVITIGSGENTADVTVNHVGDVNGDGRVNTGDVSKIYAYAKKNAELTDYEFRCADINNDGRVNTGDTSKAYAHVKKTVLLW